MLTIDYLPNHKEIKVYQDDTMFRINTDTMVLGEFLEIYKEDTVLDIGTNNGALLLIRTYYINFMYSSNCTSSNSATKSAKTAKSPFTAYCSSAL